MQKYTVSDFRRQFPDDAACLEWLAKEQYPDGIVCKKCKAVTRHHPMKTRKSYSCDRCGRHVHPTAGTIYHKSSTPLTLWFYAVYLMAQTRCGISAAQLQRELGVTYKTAWRMFKQIRAMLYDESPLKGTVEVDETYAGNKRGETKQGRGTSKAAVVGAVERGGRVVPRVVADVRGETLAGFVQSHVEAGSTVYTDKWPGYARLPEMGYGHETVDHGAREFVRGDVHTNTLEGYWSTAKMGILGVYHGVSQKYLQTYLDEYAFRANHRNLETPMFFSLLTRVSRAGACGSPS